MLQEQLKEGILDLLNEELDEEQFPIELKDKKVRDQAIKEAKNALASLNWMTREMKLRTAKRLNIELNLKPEGINWNEDEQINRQITKGIYEIFDSDPNPPISHYQEPSSTSSRINMIKS